MRPHTRGIFFGVFVMSLVACRGKELGVAVLHGTGSAEAQFQSSGKPIVLWADTDGEWEGGHDSHFPAHYEIDVFAKGAKVGHVSCDTQSSSQSVCGSTFTVNSSHRGDCELRLACAVPAIPQGPASLQVAGTAGPGTANIKKMSIKVREK